MKRIAFIIGSLTFFLIVCYFLYVDEIRPRIEKPGIWQMRLLHYTEREEMAKEYCENMYGAANNDNRLFEVDPKETFDSDNVVRCIPSIKWRCKRLDFPKGTTQKEKIAQERRCPNPKEPPASDFYNYRRSVLYGVPGGI